MSRDETEDNHDIIELSREALQDPPAAAFCGGCCVTTPNARISVVLGDSDNIRFPVLAFLNFSSEISLTFGFFLGLIQILLYPANAYHWQAKTIKVIFDFGGRFSTMFKKKYNSNKIEKLITTR